MYQQKDARHNSRIMRCARCGSLHSATKTDAGEILPDTTGPVQQCPQCGESEFDQLYLQTN